VTDAAALAPRVQLQEVSIDTPPLFDDLGVPLERVEKSKRSTSYLNAPSQVTPSGKCFQVVSLFPRPLNQDFQPAPRSPLSFRFTLRFLFPAGRVLQRNDISSLDSLPSPVFQILPSSFQLCPSAVFNYRLLASLLFFPPGDQGFLPLKSRTHAISP